jgi:hypothetical protein
MTTGNLGLTDHEEDLIVIFLGTLTDGFTTPYPDADKYTGNCLAPTALSPPPPPVSAAPFPAGSHSPSALATGEQVSPPARPFCRNAERHFAG